MSFTSRSKTFIFFAEYMFGLHSNRGRCDDLHKIVVQGNVEVCLRLSGVSAGAATHLISSPIRLLHTYLRWLLGHLMLSDPNQTAGVWLLEMDLIYYPTLLTRTHTLQTLVRKITSVHQYYLFIEVIGSKQMYFS